MYRGGREGCAWRKGGVCLEEGRGVSGRSQPESQGGGQMCTEGRAASEKWFHDLNSQNKFSPRRQNKIFKCVRKLFYFCEWQNNSCNTY